VARYTHNGHADLTTGVKRGFMLLTTDRVVTADQSWAAFCRRGGVPCIVRIEEDPATAPS